MKQLFNRRLMFIIVVIVVASLLLVLQGCTPNERKEDHSGGENAGKKYDVIKVPLLTKGSRPDALDIAEDLGWFEEEGIKLEHVGAILPPQFIPSLVSGKVDVGAGQIFRTISAIDSGAPIQVVVGGMESTKELPFMVYVTLEGSSIKNAQDLVGKKIGVMNKNSASEYIPYGYLEKNGISNPEDKVEFVVMSEQLLEQALRQGEVDVIGVNDNPKPLLARGGLRVVFTDYDVFGADIGTSPIFFSKKFIKENQDVVRRFVKVVSKVNNWINEHPQECVDMTVKRYGTDPKTLRNNYLVKDGVIRSEGIQAAIDFLKAHGKLKKDITSDKIYTDEFYK